MKTVDEILKQLEMYKKQYRNNITKYRHYKSEYNEALNILNILEEWIKEIPPQVVHEGF